MVSSVGNGSSHSAVAQVLQQQSERVDEQKSQQIAEQRRQANIELEQKTKAEQIQTNADERRGRSVDISV